jgi:hypothetical protein
MAVRTERAAIAAALAAACLLAPWPAAAGAAEEAELRAHLAEALQRLQQIDKRLKQLEQKEAETEQALATERLSEREPELVTRVKAVEFQTLQMQKQARQIEALEGVAVDANLVGMLQHVGREGGDAGQAQTRANYRGDIALSLPGGEFGDSEGAIFTQLRFGQGQGIAQRPGFSASANSTAFQVSGVSDADSSFAVLAQAWYQLTVPLPLDGFKPHSKQQLQLNAGKMDPFVFFDQNAAADDETMRFANNVFVHNPLLDSGGDVGADAYGFTPGLRLAWRDAREASGTWGLSLGVFGSGPAANFSGSLGKPFVIAQAEIAAKWWQGLPGNYRLYAWDNGRAAALDGSEEEHAGWGTSVDQQVGDSLRLFGRYGQRVRGHGGFDSALTLGLDMNGDAWQRSADGVGFAFAWLPSSSAWRDATAADEALIGSAANGAERVAELYYRWNLSSRLALTADLQWIGRPAADLATSGYWVAGLRVRLGL